MAGGLFSRFNSGLAAGAAPDLAQLMIAAGAPPAQAYAMAQSQLGRGLAPGPRPSAPPAPVDPGPGPADTAAGAPAAPSGKGPSFWRVLDGVLGGQTVTEVGDGYRARQAAQQQAAAQAADRARYADQANLSPQQRLAMSLAPGKFGEALSSGSEAYTPSPDQLRGQGGQTIQAAPGYHELGDQLIQTGAGEAPQSVFRRDPTVSEQTAQQKTMADIENAAARLGLDRDQLAEMIRSHKAGEGLQQGQLGVSRGQLGVAQGGLGLRQREYEARLKGVGGFGTPGAGGINFVPALPDGARLDP